MRKLYGESSERSMVNMAAGAERYFRIEGCLEQHDYFDGRYWDSYTLALYREDWEALIAERLPSVLGTAPSPVDDPELAPSLS